MRENNIQSANIKVMNPRKMKLEPKGKPEGNIAGKYKRNGRSQMK